MSVPAAGASSKAGGFDWAKWSPILAALGIGGGGAAAGSIAGPGSSLNEFFFGNEASLDPFDILSPAQQGFQENTLAQAQGPQSAAFQALMKLLGQDEESLKEFSAPYMRNFQTNILPSIFERFGGGDSGASSGLFNAATEAGAGLQGQIAADRQKQQLGGISALSGLTGPSLSPQKGFANTPGQPGALQGLVQALPLLLTLL